MLYLSVTSGFAFNPSVISDFVPNTISWAISTRIYYLYRGDVTICFDSKRLKDIANIIKKLRILNLGGQTRIARVIKTEYV